MPHKPEDLGSIPRTHIKGKALGHALIPVLGRWRGGGSPPDQRGLRKEAGQFLRNKTQG